MDLTTDRKSNVTQDRVQGRTRPAEEHSDGCLSDGKRAKTGQIKQRVRQKLSVRPSVRPCGSGEPSSGLQPLSTSLSPQSCSPSSALLSAGASSLFMMLHSSPLCQTAQRGRPPLHRTTLHRTHIRLASFHVSTALLLTRNICWRPTVAALQRPQVRAQDLQVQSIRGPSRVSPDWDGTGAGLQKP